MSRCVSLFVAFKDPDMVWLCAVWSASTSSSWQLWTPSTVSSHTAHHQLHFTCCGSTKDKFTAQPQELHEPTLLRGLLHARNMQLSVEYGEFCAPSEGFLSIFQAVAFRATSLLFCFLRGELLCERRHNSNTKARQSGVWWLRGELLFLQLQHCDSLFFWFCFFLLFRLLSRWVHATVLCRCILSYGQNGCKADPGWCPSCAAAHTSVHICGIFPSNKQLSPTNEHML